MKSLCVPACILSLSIVSLFQPAPTQAQQPIQHAPDGGSREHIDSIDIPATPNAPFSAVVVTVLTRVLPDGSKQVTSNHRTVARDSSGRVFQERRHFSPNGDTAVTPLGQTQYEDPNQHELLLCTPAHSCQRYTFAEAVLPPAQNASLQPLLKLPNGNIIKNEDLGRNNMEGVDVTGSRETLTVAAGVQGNDKPQDVVKEFWYSPQLGINVRTLRADPRISSIQTFNVTQLTLAEPDPKLFAPPSDYKIVSMDRPDRR
jgi:hypothetical protein